MGLLFTPYPLCKTFAPKEDGIFIVKKQGRVAYVGLAYKKETGKNIKEALKSLFKSGNDVHEHFYDMREIMAVKTVKGLSYEEALKKQQELIKKHKTDTKYNKPKEESKEKYLNPGGKK